MKNDKYNMHTSEHIRNIGKDSGAKKSFVGFRLTAISMLFIVVVYVAIKINSPAEQSEQAAEQAAKVLQINPILYIIAGGILLLCILVAILIKVIKNKQ